MLSLRILGLCFVPLGIFAGASSAGGKASALPSPIVVIETSMGTIKVELDPDRAPVTVKNFLSYVEEKFYDGLIFHRVIEDFMIQGGGFEPGLKKEKKTRDPIANESANNLSNAAGTIAMARLPEPNTATSQFYINVKDNFKLDRARAQDGVGYCVFGRVIDGFDVVKKINRVKTGRVMEMNDVPLEDVVIKSIRVQPAK